ncbi:lytic murein transglycosylase [Frankia sp. Mgl5]|uniref:lytic transglycosylase domain-containing protein n=1 Tax=Frankia sp. Mgl5 TaxID=2933793 RepID=UPI00200C96A1|nr:lytic murein transglycosylase [Frankia sp. Mgl5]MCK9929252.1 lytic murein transglycosylase [Frankia sp. Mgl5]
MIATAGLLLLCSGAAARPESEPLPSDQASRWNLADSRPPGTAPTDVASLTEIPASLDPLGEDSGAPGDDDTDATTAPGDETGGDGSAGSGSDDGSGPAGTVITGGRGVPDRVLDAYRQAAGRVERELPGCHLPWELLAAIGKIESGHAAGRPMADDGTVTRPILGPVLDGRDGRALIRDSDDGVFDGDATLDRAVGPMQFIPTTWRTSGRDGSGDGRRDPQNIHDATLAAGGYLCAHGRDVSRPDQLRAAIFSYNPSASYVNAVLTWMTAYREKGATALPGEPAQAGDPEPAIPELTAPEPAGDPLVPAEPTTPAEPTAPAEPSPPAPSEPPAGPGPSLPAGGDGGPRVEVAPEERQPGGGGEVGEEPVSAALRDLGIAVTDLAVTPVELDGAAAGFEALDLTSARRPAPAGPLRVAATAATEAGRPIARSEITIPAEPDRPAQAASGGTGAASGAAGTTPGEEKPTLLARLAGGDLAAAGLPAGRFVLTLEAHAESGRVYTVRLLVSQVNVKAFVARPAATGTPPTGHAPSPKPPASAPGPSTGSPAGTPRTPVRPATPPAASPPAASTPATSKPATSSPAASQPATSQPATTAPAAVGSDPATPTATRTGGPASAAP